MIALGLDVERVASDRGRAFLDPTFWDRAPHPSLDERGYRVDEYLVRGTSRIFSPDDEPSGASDAYATRALVIAPRRGEDFSGVVHVELLNPSVGEDWPMFWPDGGFHLMERGDAYIGVSCTPETVAALIYRDSARYGELSFPHHTLIWDLIGAVAGACRTAYAGGLLPWPTIPDRVFLTGWSQSGSFIRTYLGERLHDEHTAVLRADGVDRDVYDGYLIGVSSGGFGPMGYVELGRDAVIEFDENFAPLHPNPRQLDMTDARRMLWHAPVPVIEYMSEDEAIHHVWHRRPDSDVPGDTYRCYQIPGRGHETGLLTLAARRSELDAATLEQSDPPLHEASRWLLAAVITHLVEWSEGVEPPRANPIRLDVAAGTPDPRGLDYSAVTVCRDAWGHTQGGIRHLDVDVPTTHVSIDENGPAIMRAWVEQPADVALLAAEYGSFDSYAARVAAAADHLVESGWLLPRHRADAVRAAERRYKA